MTDTPEPLDVNDGVIGAPPSGPTAWGPSSATEDPYGATSQGAPPTPTERELARTYFRPPVYLVVSLAITLVVGLVFLVGSFNGKDDAPTGQAEASGGADAPVESDVPDWAEVLSDVEPEPLPASGTFGDGLWIIPSDAQGAVYRATSPAAVDGEFAWCFWTTYSGDVASEEAILDLKFTGGGIPTVVLDGVGLFESDDCGEWTRVDPATLFDNPDAPARISMGEWLVGEDVAPGLYRLTSPPAPDETGMVWCTWFLYDGPGQSSDRLIENAFPAGGLPTVELAGGQTFASDSCGEWLPVDPATLFDNTDAATEFGEGVWLVGEDIAPGTYTMKEDVREVNGWAYCSWSIFSTWGGASESGLEWGSSEDAKETMTVAVGQQFDSTGCGDWELVSR